MRPSVVVIELEILREALVHTNRHGVVVGADAAEDVGHSAEGRITTLSVSDGGVSRAGQHAASANAVGEWESTCGRRIDVGVDEVRQVAAEAAEVTDGDGGFPRKFPCGGEVGLVNGWRLELGVEEDNAQSAIGRWRSSVNLGERRSASSRGIEAERELTAADAGVDQRIVNRRVDGAAVVDAVAATDGGFSITEDIVGEADGRAPVVRVGG